MQNETKITILIADDNVFYCEGIRTLFKSKAPEIDIVGEAKRAEEIKYLIENLHPRVLLLDLAMPNFSPVDLIRWTHENYPNTAILILTSHTDEALLANTMKEGAIGYLDKSLSALDLISAIHRAMDGEILFEQAQQKKVIQWNKEVGGKLQALTAQERAILGLLAKGADNTTIAKTLKITRNTVVFHTKSIFKKLDVESRLQAGLWAAKHLLDSLS
jgi:DNA-binding NarL/FixJ family response regulator